MRTLPGSRTTTAPSVRPLALAEEFDDALACDALARGGPFGTVSRSSVNRQGVAPVVSAGCGDASCPSVRLCG